MAHNAHPGQPHNWLHLGQDMRWVPGDATVQLCEIKVCVTPGCGRDKATPVK